MKIEKEHLDTHEASLTVELDAETVDKAMKAAARRISRQARIPGFRKGKAPYWRIVQAFGSEVVFEEAMEELSQDVYKSALDETGIEPYGPGSLESVEQEPVVLKYRVPLQPDVELGEYREIRIPFEEPEVTDEQLGEAMQNLRESRVIEEPVERPADWGDKVSLDIFVVTLEADQETLGEEEEIDASAIVLDRDGREEPFDFVIDEDRDLVPGFAEQLVGMEVGDEKTFIIEVDEDYEDESLAEERLFFEVEVMEIESRNLPELNDTFAADVTEGEYESLLDLRMEMRKQLQEQMERDAEEPYLDQIFEEILENSKILYPPVMVDEAIENEMNRLDMNLRQQGLTLEDFLRIRSMSREELGEEYREAAVRNLERSLVLGQVLEAEELEIPDEELRDEMKSALNIDVDPEQFGPQLMNSFRQNMLTQRVINRLLDIAKGKNPPKGPDPKPEKKEKVTSEHVATLDGMRDEMEAQQDEDDESDIFPGQRVEGGIVRID